ncbi:CPBP family intramembrane glutamic endopeptidase [Cognatilysobacter bugurensis]|nr:CPBP family intramembrane glutamic endopeptidase [Lysobacter bugurensis]
MLLVAGLIVATGGAHVRLNADWSLTSLLSGAWVVLWEELLFRGFVFQRLIDGVGALAAIAVSAGLFAVAHGGGNPGLDGTACVVATVDTALGAVLLGLAYPRTGRLALPIGIHFGWHWAQGSVLGFDVSGAEHAGWLLPELTGRPQWFAGRDFGPEASIFAVLVDATAVLLMRRWKAQSGNGLLAVPASAAA